MRRSPSKRSMVLALFVALAACLLLVGTIVAVSRGRQLPFSPKCPSGGETAEGDLNLTIRNVAGAIA